MKKIGLATAMICLAGPVFAAPVLNAPADVAAIKTLEQQNAVQLDPAALARNFAPHAVVLDYMTGGIYRGRPAVERAVAPILAPVKSVSADLSEQNILTDGNFACDLLTADFRFVTKSGTRGAISLRQMDALQKIDGRWQVVQEQIAMLKDPKSDNAVTGNLPVRGDMVWPAAMDNFDIVPPAQADKEILQWSNVTFRAVGIDAIVPFYGPDKDELAMYAPTAPGNLRGLAEMHDYYAPSMNYFKSLVVKTPVLETASDGALGSEISIQLITLHLRNGKSEPLYWRQSDCVHRVGGKWYGFMNMSSFPLDLKTGKLLTMSTFLVPENSKTDKSAASP